MIMGLREEPFLVRSGLLVLIKQLPDRLRREDVPSFLDWEKQFLAKRDEFVKNHLASYTVSRTVNTNADGTTSMRTDTRDDISAAFQCLGIFIRHLSKCAMEAFRDGEQVFEMPEDVKKLRGLAMTNAQGRGSAALIANYLASKESAGS
jgi:hypothetical protein